jgi:hypothetical protein
LEGKLNATTALHKALCEAFELQSDWKAPLPVIELGTEFTDADPVAVLHEVFCKIGKLQEDDQALRQILGLPAADRGRYFDQQRISYSFRREFSAYRCKSPADPEIQVVLRALGFSLI